jgi:tRNA(fMet)-specific endonuclease VapC
MKYALDTDIISYFLKGTQKNVIDSIEGINPDNICTTIFNFSELLFGAYLKLRKNSNLFITINNFLKDIEILQFDKTSAEIFADSKAKLYKKGKPLADLDLLIACTCISNNATLVTHNTKHFSRIKGLKTEDWSLKREV